MQNPELWQITEGVDKNVDGGCRAAQFPAAPWGWRSLQFQHLWNQDLCFPMSQESVGSQTTLGLSLARERLGIIQGV